MKKQVQKTDPDEYSWVGPPVDEDKDSVYYNGVRLESKTAENFCLSVGESAYFHSDGPLPYVGDIESFYERKDSKRFFVKARWYYRISDVRAVAPKALEGIVTEGKIELFSSNDCDENLVVSILRPCLVIKMSIGDEIPFTCRGSRDMFICRYKFILKGTVGQVAQLSQLEVESQSKRTNAASKAMPVMSSRTKAKAGQLEESPTQGKRTTSRDAADGTVDSGKLASFTEDIVIHGSSSSSSTQVSRTRDFHGRKRKNRELSSLFMSFGEKLPESDVVISRPRTSLLAKPEEQQASILVKDESKPKESAGNSRGSTGVVKRRKKRKSELDGLLGIRSLERAVEEEGDDDDADETSLSVEEKATTLQGIQNHRKSKRLVVPPINQSTNVNVRSQPLIPLDLENRSDSVVSDSDDTDGNEPEESVRDEEGEDDMARDDDLGKSEDANEEDDEQEREEMEESKNEMANSSNLVLTIQKRHFNPYQPTFNASNHSEGEDILVDMNDNEDSNPAIGEDSSSVDRAEVDVPVSTTGCSNM